MAYESKMYRGTQEGGAPGLVIDILETWFGDWFTVMELVDHVKVYRPRMRTETIRRGIERLIAKGLVDVRVVDATNGRGHPMMMRQVSLPERQYLSKEAV